MRIWVEAKDDLKWRLEFDGKNKEGFTYYIIKKSNYLSKCLK